MALPEDKFDPEAVGLFPLPNVILFPGMLLPLMVFEPRYKALVADALADDQVIGVPRLKPGYETEYHGTPPIFDTLGVGRIIQHEELDDGRYRILLQGVSRAQIVEETQTDPYRIARVKALTSEERLAPPAVIALRSELLRIVTQVAPRLASPADKLIEGVRDAETASACADLVAATLVESADKRQHLLDKTVPSERIEILITELHDTLSRLDPAGPHSSSLN